jgi:hypothetical protein
MQPDPSLVPPTKANLKAWWNHFTFAQKLKKETEGEKEGTHPSERDDACAHYSIPPPRADAPGPSVFGKPLKECLKYASVQISTVDANGERYVWGHVPVVVAKWCVIYTSIFEP